MLASEVIERTYSVLYPGGVDRPGFDVLAANIASTTATTFTATGRAGFIPPDTMVEIGSELMLLSAYDTATNVATIQDRGYLESAPSTHTAGTKIWLDPDFPRIEVFNAIKGIIGMLYGWGLYRRLVDITSTISSNAPITLTATAKEVLSARYKSGTRWYPLQSGEHYEVFEDTGGAIEVQFFGGQPGASLRLVYAADFTQPTSEADDLDTLGVPATLQPFLPIAVAGHLLVGRESSRVQLDEVRRQLEAQNVQVGASMSVGQNLLDFFIRNYVSAEKRRLAKLDPPRISYARA